ERALIGVGVAAAGFHRKGAVREGDGAGAGGAVAPVDGRREIVGGIRGVGGGESGHLLATKGGPFGGTKAGRTSAAGIVLADGAVLRGRANGRARGVAANRNFDRERALVGEGVAVVTGRLDGEAAIGAADDARAAAAVAPVDRGREVAGDVTGVRARE